MIQNLVDDRYKLDTASIDVGLLNDPATVVMLLSSLL